MTSAQLLQSAQTDAAAPASLSPEATTLWLIKANRWDEAHDIAQEIPSRTGSWLHALLHLIEGDLGNAGYWFARAGRPAVPVSEIDAEWDRLAAEILPGK
jgi:hypothetical protein